MRKAAVILLALLLSAITLSAQDATVLYDRKPYYIQSAMNFGQNDGGFWDIPGSPQKIDKRMNIQVWGLENDKSKDRKYYMLATDQEGYYEINPGWEKDIRIDISGGEKSVKTNGANIATWTKNGKDWQKFRFKHLGNGRFKIYTTAGMVICLDGRKNTNGTNVHIWADHDGPWMEWYLIDTETNQPFIPQESPAYAKNSPAFFEQNKDKTFKYIISLAFVAGKKGTAKVTSITGNDVTLSVTAEGENPMNGQMETKTFEMKLKHKDGKYVNGDWDCMECGQGEVKIYPDGRQVLELSGEQHSIELILEAE